MSEPIDGMRRMLREAALLRENEGLIASVVGARILSILVDALLELDLEFVDPWTLLAVSVSPETPDAPDSETT
jgi:hypothetical protein